MPQRLDFRDLVFSVDEWEFQITYRDYMIVRFGFLVAASLAACAVRKINTRTSKSTSSIKPSANGEANNYWNGGEDEDRDSISNDNIGEKNENEEEKVKLAGRVTNPALTNPLDIEDEEILTKFEELLTGERDSPLPNDESHLKAKSYAEEARVNEMEMGKDANELERLHTLVKELEEKEVKLQGELIEFYCLKKQQSNVAGLQKELKMKGVENNMLNKTINTLQAEKRKLQDEVSKGDSARKELEVARNKLKEFQRQLQLEANQTKGQLLLLKQQVSSLQAKEEEAIKKNVEVEMKHKAVMDLEVEVLELKRRNKELQQEKRELSVKLDAAEARISALSSATESEMVYKAREEVQNLKHATEDMLKQVERLQKNRFSEVEELVYLRWVNACMRFELRTHPTPGGKTSSARVLNKSLSPKSREKAKQMVLEYAGSEHCQRETDGESNSSHPSSSGSEDFDNTSINGSTSKHSRVDKKQSLIQKLKKWGKSKDELSTLSSSSRSLSGGAPSQISTGHRRTSSMEALMFRDAGDGMAIMTFGKMEEDQVPPRSLKAPNLPLIRTHDTSGDSPPNAVLAPFQLMLKSFEGIVDDKYLAYKDRHQLALEREKQIKLRAEQARAEKFGNNSCLHSTYETRVTTEIEKEIRWLPLKHSQIREMVVDIGDPADKSNNAKTTEILMASKIKLADIMNRPPRVLCPPPKPRGGAPGTSNSSTVSGTTPAKSQLPPPSGPPLSPPVRVPSPTRIGNEVHRAQKDNTYVMTSSVSNVTDARTNTTIGELENQLAFSLAVKADVETQGDFIQSLAAEVRVASFTNIKDLLSFVNWLDEELSFLVDERSVLKHFDWPEGKVDALREAAFEFQDLMKLEKQVSTFDDDPKLPWETVLKKMYTLLEKVEQSLYALLLTRDMAVSRFREFGIPFEWLSDSGLVGQIKLASVTLARKYMKRVAAELDALRGSETETCREFLALQGVRFAFRVHQFVKAFDAETMVAFEELKSRIPTQTRADDRQET